MLLHLKKMGLSPTAAAGSLAAFNKLKTISLDDVANNDTDKDGISLLDKLKADDDVENTILSQEWLIELHDTLMKALEEILANIRKIIIKHYFQGVPLAKIAEERGLTRQTLYNQEVAAFKYIRAGKYGIKLADFMPSHRKYKRAKRIIEQDKRALEEMALTDTEKGLLIL